MLALFLLLAGAALTSVVGMDLWRRHRRVRLAHLLGTAPVIPRSPRPSEVRGGKRVQRQMLTALPLWVELLALALDAGLTLSEAMRRVAGGLPGPLSAAMLQVLLEQAAGKSGEASWKEFMRRYPQADLRAVALIMGQAARYGNPVADQLRYLVQQARIREQTRLQSVVRSAAVKMKLPMVVLMLFPFVSLLLAPALLSMAQMLGR